VRRQLRRDLLGGATVHHEHVHPQVRCGGCPGRGGGGGQRHGGTAGAGGEQEAAAAQGSTGHRRPSGASVTRWLPAGTANEAERAAVLPGSVRSASANQSMCTRSGVMSRTE